VGNETIKPHIEMDVELLDPDPSATPVDDRTHEDAIALRQELGYPEDPDLDDVDMNIQTPLNEPF